MSADNATQPKALMAEALEAAMSEEAKSTHTRLHALCLQRVSGRAGRRLRDRRNARDSR